MVSGNRTQLSLTLLAAAIMGACGYNQPNRFQMSFLPPAPKLAPAIELPEPAPVEPNHFLKSDLPAILVPKAAAPGRRTQGDTLMQQAERHYQAGKRFYQIKDLPNARREFDAAIDLMLEASDQDPGDRQEFEKKLDDLADAIHRFDLADLGAAARLDQDKFEKAPLEDILPMTFPVDPKLKDRVREQVAATTSQLPLTVNDSVLGYINYFSNRGHRTLLNGLERSGKYRPMILRILDEEGVPRELLHLAQAESGFLPRAISRKAAGGMWQFLKWRGNEYGLKQTPDTDDRMDPEMATRSAARHLRALYQEFGDWYLAIAAYNCGPGVIEKAVERTGYADFWELRAREVLPAETTNYVPIILAMTIMEKNAAEYGIDGFQLDPPLEYDTIQTGGPTSLSLIADLLDMPLPELAGLNPASLRGKLPENYPLHIPKGTSNRLMAALQLIPPNRLDAWRMHRVSAGDSLATIGKRYGVTAAAIVAANHLEKPQAVEGDRLLIPTVARADAPAPQVKKVSSPTARRRTGATHPTTTSSARPSVKPTPRSGATVARASN
jgi:membrane-bound lytic murein transglycosylase D